MSSASALSKLAAAEAHLMEIQYQMLLDLKKWDELLPQEEKARRAVEKAKKLRGNRKWFIN